MAKAKTKATDKTELKFYQKLVLNRFLLKQFGADSFKALADNLKNPSLELIDEEGVTGFHKHIVHQRYDRLLISERKLAEYDLNIVSHIRKINDKRDTPLSLKYFQYLTLLFVEYYLDRFCNDRQGFLAELNQFVDDFNTEYSKDTLPNYVESDLNKIAIWNATGSGKTILMHINYYQYSHYTKANFKNENSTFILLTPKEGLSQQHLVDYAEAGIKATMYDKNTSRGSAGSQEINILENTKLDIKDGDKKVSVKRFGDKNVVFVDEGHRGASGDTWYKFRNMLCTNGFSFEYSATFGQAVSGNKSLTAEYAKCILFDYSYKYFYGDGYGKEYNIINLPEDQNEQLKHIYLAACLLTYYQQKRLYGEQNKAYDNFNLENPLFVFVGASVNAVRTEKGRKVSDVVDILLFFNKFITEKGIFTDYIKRVLQGNTGLLDHSNHDIFRGSYTYLTALNISPSEIYQDILKQVFNCATSAATLHVENLKGVSGEIRLRLGENDPFGVINIGDDSALMKLCDENNFHTNSVDFSDSLFAGITKKDSTINLLIGSKKFTEGWNCWRVSTMGLMNVGRSEGSEIIQLFGRGVRLKGYEMSLKRSHFFIKDRPDVSVPKHTEILETLNVFGVRADYMKEFKKFLEDEGVPTDKEKPFVITMPIIRNKQYKKNGLLSLQLKNGLLFKKDAPKISLVFDERVGSVELDCYAKVQFETSKPKSTVEATKDPGYFTKVHLSYLDYDTIVSDLRRYKNEKSKYNVNILKEDIISLLQNNSWYKLLIPKEELEIKSFSDFKRFEKIAIALLIKYFDKYYYMVKNNWEKPLLELVALDDENDNFVKNDEYTITINNSNSSENAEMISWIETLKDEITTAKKTGAALDFSKPKYDMEAIAFSSILYNPVLYSASKNLEISVLPVALNESERDFIKALREYVVREKDFFNDKEMYVVRNKSKKGVGFFEGSGFFPDFIMWLIADEKQYITFIDPHGMRTTSLTDSKVGLARSIKNIEQQQLSSKAILNSFLLSPTKHMDMVEKNIPIEEWKKNNVLFMDDPNYLQCLFKKILES